MINSANKVSISNLLNPDGNDGIYEIPRYQREYQWQQSHWEQLFDDLFDNEEGYFIGSIICIRQSKYAHYGQKYELIDGQQRFTTISLLLAAIYRSITPFMTSFEDMDLVAKYVNLKNKLVIENTEQNVVQPRLVLQRQNQNSDDYKAILSEAGVSSQMFEIPKNAGNRRIFKAFRFFNRRIDLILEQKQEEELHTLVNFLKKIDQGCFVKIEVDTTSDAYILFESLNDRGMPLSAIDLIKNKLLSHLTVSSELSSSNDLYYDQWSKLLDNLGDQYYIQERFLRQNYNAFKQDLKHIITVPIATKSNLIKIYDALISNDAKLFLENTLSNSRIYSHILLRNQMDDFKEINSSLTKLERIQGATSYTLLLYLMSKKQELKLTSEHYKGVIDSLISFFVRRHTTDNPPTRDLDKIFMNIIEDLNGFSDVEIPSFIGDRLHAVSSSDELFEEKLRGPIYDENKDATRFILTSLAERGMSKESYIDLWRKERDKLVWTVEHIFPQGKSIPKPWIEMVSNGDESKAKKIFNKYVHTLGNLTITGFNSNLGNKSFLEKRDRLDQEGRPIGYKNGLELNIDLINVQTWGKSQIKKRTDRLVHECIEEFKLPFRE